MRALKSRLFRVLVFALSAPPLAVLLAIQGALIYNGARVVALNGLRILTDPPPLPTSTEPAGGVGPSLAGTLAASGLALAISTPISLLFAFLLVEWQGKRAAVLLRACYTSLYGLPTIVVSLIVYATLVVATGTQSLLAGAVSLALAVLPMQISYFEAAFSSIPRTYLEAGHSLGLGRGGVLYRVAMGIAKPYLASSIAVAAARAMGETAPLLFTIGNAVYVYPSSLMQPSSTMTTLIFYLASSPFRGQAEFAWGAALVLYIIYLATFAASKAVRGVQL